MTAPSGPPQGSGGFPGQAPAPGYSPGAHAAPSTGQSGSSGTNGGMQHEVHTLERAIFEEYLKELHILSPGMADAYENTTHCIFSYLMDTTT